MKKQATGFRKVEALKNLFLNAKNRKGSSCISLRSLRGSPRPAHAGFAFKSPDLNPIICK
jgi:hypothetical protein